MMSPTSATIHMKIMAQHDADLRDRDRRAKRVSFLLREKKTNRYKLPTTEHSSFFHRENLYVFL